MSWDRSSLWAFKPITYRKAVQLRNLSKGVYYVEIYASGILSPTARLNALLVRVVDMFRWNTIVFRVDLLELDKEILYRASLKFLAR